jgi:small subunit ribosomal protein S17
MAEEEKNENEEQAEAAEAPVDETVDSGQPTEAQDEAPEAEAPAEEAPAEETPAPEPEEAPDEPAEEAPPGAGDPEPEPEAAPAQAPEPEAEPVEQLGPKERRRAARSQHTGEAAPQRSVEDRARERAEGRRQKAAERRRWRQRSRERRRAEPSAEPPAAVEHASASPRVRQGIVVSNRADKTITVKIENVKQHRMYGKVMRTGSTLHAHDESNDANIGDTVRVVESRPISRLKRWRLVEVLERAR